MTDETTISGLNKASGINESDIFPVVSVKETVTEQVSLSTLRNSIYFQNAFSDHPTALAATDKGDMYFVYTDTTETYVKGWVNQGGSNYSAMIGVNGDVIFPAGNLFSALKGYVVGVDSITDLRTLEPLYNEQQVKLVRMVSNGAIINATAIYDSTDTTSADDGYRIFKTTNGAIWKIDVTEGLDARLGGLLADGSNLGTALNTIINGEVAKIIAGNSVDAGVVAIKIPIPATPNFTGDTYTLDVPVNSTSFISLLFKGSMLINVPAGQNGFVFDNTLFTVSTTLLETQANWRNGAILIDVEGGILNIKGGDNTAANVTHIGIFLGNTYASTTVPDMANTYIRNVKITNFNIGLAMRGFDTYINTFENLTSAFNNENFTTPYSSNQNSGEKIVFKSCVISNAVTVNIHQRAPGFNILFSNTSIDYAGTNSIWMHECYGSLFRFTDGSHIEGFGQYMVAAGGWSTYAPSTEARNVFIFENTTIVCSGGTQRAYAPRRGIIVANSNYCSFIFRNTPVIWVSDPSQPMTTLLAPGTTANVYWESPYSQTYGTLTASSGEEILPTINHGINYGKYNWAYSAGTVLTNATDSGTGLYLKSSDSTKITAVIGAQDSFTYGGNAMGFYPVTITSTDATASIEIQANNLSIPWVFNERLNVALSVKMTSVTSGSPTIQAGATIQADPVYSTTASTTTTNGTSTTTYSTTKSYKTTISGVGKTAFDIGALLSSTNTTLDATQYVGVQASYLVDTSNVKPMVASPKIILTGFVGTISVVFPIFWVSKGTLLSGASAGL